MPVSSEPIFSSIRRNQLLSAREQAQRLLARELLVAIDLRAKRVHAGDREVDVRPRVERRDVHAVAVDADLDAVIDDRAELVDQTTTFGSDEVTQRNAAIWTPHPSP